MLETESIPRLRWLVRLMLVWAAIIIARLVYLQVIQHEEYQRQAQIQHEKQIEVPAPRGAIFDRNGQALAKSIPVDSVCVNPLRVPDLAVASEILSKVLDLDGNELLGKMRLAVDAQRGFLWVKRRITPEESNRIRSLNLDWIEFRQESRRFYPDGQLAAHVIGSVDFAEKGNAGIEQSLDDDLAGRSGEETIVSDVKQRAFAAEIANEAQPGRDVVLSIDSRIQYVAEKELAAAAEKAHASTGAVVVMNPRNGEILALASWPTFDPNQLPKPGESLAFRNNVAVTTPYEPGSVFKVVTLSAALETTNLTPASVINCNNGVLHLPGRVVHEAHHGYGLLSMADVLAKSSNIGAIQIATRMGQQNLFDYVKRFGFGKETGIPLPSESSGLFKPLRKWGVTTYASVAMGHEISVTALQLARTCSVIANGGMLVRPKLIVKRQRAGEPTEPEPDDPPKRILTPETAITMRQMMEGVVLHGTGKAARLRGYTVGGKTGTAQIYDFAGHSYTHKYNGSFMGFAPLQNPAIAMVVTLNGTNGTSGYGGAVAAPVFHEIATAALRFLYVPRDLPDDLPAEKDDGPNDTYDLSIAGLDPSDGSELLSSVPPLVQGPPAMAGPDQRTFLPASNQLVGPKVPDFTGMTMREVVQEAAAGGLQLEMVGRGIARAQLPPAGSMLPRGEKVRVAFGR
jgi:cell division protein FtsI (penicillin-binding protein 3)